MLFLQYVASMNAFAQPVNPVRRKSPAVLVLVASAVGKCGKGPPFFGKKGNPRLVGKPADVGGVNFAGCDP